MNPDPAEDKLKNSKWYAVIARGSMAFRFGPFEPPVVGKIMEQCHREGIPASFVADMGPEFDWALARDLRGYSTVVQKEPEPVEG